MQSLIIFFEKLRQRAVEVADKQARIQRKILA